MAAYMLIRCRIDDAKAFAGYAQRAAELVTRFGGRYIVRGGPVEVLEGDPGDGVWVVSRWPDKEAARAFWESPEYREVARVRAPCSEAHIVLVEGVSDD